MLATFLDGTPAFDAALERLEARGETAFQRGQPAVREILAAVKAEGDVAVQRYNEKFGRRAPELVLRNYPGATALARLQPEAREALEIAAARIRGFHEGEMRH